MRFAISDEKEIIMSKKDLKYFMRPTEPEIITAPGPDSFKDSEGKTIDFEIKVLTQSSITKINDRYKRRIMATDKKGNPLINGNTLVFREEDDRARAVRHLIVEALQYPNLNDPELMKHYNCVDVTDMPLLVFSKPDEYAHVVNIVLSALGMTGVNEDNAEVEGAKNS